MYKSVFKRLLDIVLCIIGLIIFSPIIIFTAITLFLQNNGKVFFIQQRPGLNQKPFYILKFKTMTDERDNQGNLLPDVDRITRFGGFVRRLSIDELPQLLNVLKGEMSIIGPRPLLFKYIPLYTKHQLRRHEVRPGITGLAQVNGRNCISWMQKFDYDVKYINNLTFFLDFKIFLVTIKKVIIREGVNQSAERPTEPFNGKN
jgi:undecaprenyl phosphate N,N'-diacetylbacillosamine 1-phosphate transferase